VPRSTCNDSCSIQTRWHYNSDADGRRHGEGFHGYLSFETIDVITGGTVVSMAMRWKLDWQDKPNASDLITWNKRRPRSFLARDASMERLRVLSPGPAVPGVARAARRP
jgi:hypothetical protein